LFVCIDDEIFADQRHRRAVDENVGLVVVDGSHDASILDQNGHFYGPSAV
jgi:hypothetical protein